jgi:hypothetical protein
MSGDAGLRLYEVLDTVAAALPPERRIHLLAVCRRPAWGLPDTPEHRRFRTRLHRLVPELARDDWKRMLWRMQRPGAAEALHRWAVDAGHVRSSSS